MRKLKLTEDELEFENAKNHLKHLTASWYQRMCGEMDWKEGEREEYETKFALAIGQLNALEFAMLPEC